MTRPLTCAVLLFSPVQISKPGLDFIHGQNEWSHCHSTWKTHCLVHVNRAVAKQRTSCHSGICCCKSQLSGLPSLQHRPKPRDNMETLANRMRAEVSNVMSQQVNNFVFKQAEAPCCLAHLCVMPLPVESFLNRVFITVPCSFTLSHSLTISPAATKCSTSRSAITCSLKSSNTSEKQISAE